MRMYIINICYMLPSDSSTNDIVIVDRPLALNNSTTTMGRIVSIPPLYKSQLRDRTFLDKCDLDSHQKDFVAFTTKSCSLPLSLVSSDLFPQYWYVFVLVMDLLHLTVCEAIPIAEETSVPTTLHELTWIGKVQIGGPEVHLSGTAKVGIDTLPRKTMLTTHIVHPRPDTGTQSVI
jgi:hypothetical protein